MNSMGTESPTIKKGLWLTHWAFGYIIETY